MKVSFWSRVFLAIIALAFLLMCASCNKDDCSDQLKARQVLEKQMSEIASKMEQVSAILDTVSAAGRPYYLGVHAAYGNEYVSLGRSLQALKDASDCF